jgi:hypothetical protein
MERESVGRQPSRYAAGRDDASSHAIGHDGAEVQPVGQVHRMDGDIAAGRLDTFSRLERQPGRSRAASSRSSWAAEQGKADR